jgi:hypothetical protein
VKFRARLPLWCAVPAGVISAHAIGYFIAYRNAQYRADILAATGHGYLGHAALIAILSGTIAVSIAVARGIRDAKATRWWDAAVRIALLQAAAFFGVEILERIAAGVGPMAGMSRVFVIGAAVQLGVGAIVAGVLALFERAGRTIATVASSERRERAPQSVRRVAPETQTLSGRFVALADTARGPPLLLASN